MFLLDSINYQIVQGLESDCVTDNKKSESYVTQRQFHVHLGVVVSVPTIVNVGFHFHRLETSLDFALIV